MAVLVAVVEPLGALRAALSQGIAAAGFAVEEPADLESWAGQPGGRAVVLSVVKPADRKRLAELSLVQPELPLVALLDDAEADQYRLALRAGATAAAPRGADPATVVRVLQAALAGLSLVPARVVRLLAAAGRPDDEDMIGPLDVSWLRHLAGGATVQQLACRSGYSEREMYRLLHDLYERMGVRNRSEAIARAARWGLLDER